MKKICWMTVGACCLALACRSGVETANALVYVVVRGDLTVEVTERAEIRPEQTVRLHSALPGRSTIIYLIPEGTMVETGQKLVELDVSKLADRRLQQEIRVTRADGARKMAEEKLALERDELGESHPQVASTEADVAAKQKLYDLEVARLRKLEASLANAVIRAPSPGLVVYASQHRRSGADFIEEGATVRERQALIELPDLTRMTAIVNVHESAIDRVRVGQPATIRVDAFVDRDFSGTVGKIAAVGTGGDAQIYATEIGITGENTGLKPGMTASVSIQVAELSDVLLVPVQTLHRRDSSTLVWLDTPDGPTARTVEVGQSDTRFAEIVAGLDAGDRVHLQPPTGS